MEHTRYIVGIDLGTTNIAVAYLDTESDRGIELFPVPQLTAPGEIHALDLLPSFCYLPGAADLTPAAIRLPWDPQPDHVVGVLAREQGALVPGRLVCSAKSWLAHAGVDRTKRILPWGGDLGDQQRSPVEVASRYLSHVCHAWDARFGDQRDQAGNPVRLAEQQVIVTVPASFDETARDLTIQAARGAGLRNFVLLEEPLAAFYAWLNRHEATWREHLQPGEKLLVIDVGGGTTDFSFIGLEGQGRLHRFAVGDHLLLGGDNIDLAIARQVEGDWRARLDARLWAMLTQLCRRAKERLLETGAASDDILLLAPGSSLLQNTRKYVLRREELLRLVLDGFYPCCPADAPPPKQASGMREMGLPYAAEPAVTVHLLHFLKYAATIAGATGLLYPDKLLYNGGSLRAREVQQRLVAAIAAWFPGRPPPQVLDGEDLSLAVAMGAAYYGRVRRGHGVKVRGGIARSYFLAAADARGDRRLVCVMPRDTDENVDVPVPGDFQAQTNTKVQFALYSSATRLKDQPGDHVALADSFTLVAPMVTLLQFGKTQPQDLGVRLLSRLTEVGTLEVLLESTTTAHRWPLRFDTRPAAGPAPAADSVTVDLRRVQDGQAALSAALNGSGADLDALTRTLEARLELPRDDWSLPVLRALADTLAERDAARRTSPRHERRWLNLAGYCLRPGFGDPADELRLRQAWKSWFAGPAHTRDPQIVAEWWVFWRRLAPGLKGGQQTHVAATLAKILLPKGAYRPNLREGEQAQREMWRCLGSLEHLEPQVKADLGAALLALGGPLPPHLLWVLGRFGARRLFHASAELTLPPATAADWTRRLLPKANSVPGDRLLLFALAQLAAVTGDRSRDLPADLQERVTAYLEAQHCPAAWLARMRGQLTAQASDQAVVLGDTLPVGLKLTEAG